MASTKRGLRSGIRGPYICHCPKETTYGEIATCYLYHVSHIKQVAIIIHNLNATNLIPFRYANTKSWRNDAV